MSTLKERMEGHEKRFNELGVKLKEADEQIVKLTQAKQAIWDEMNIIKGRFNELREIEVGETSGKGTSGESTDNQGNGGEEKIIPISRNRVPETSK